jgi:hypothetical protein
MRSRFIVLLALLTAASAVPTLALAQRASTPGPCSSGTLAATASYRLALVIGARQEMYLPSEVSARHIKSGQVMLGGEMTMMEQAPAGTRLYNLEVHVCTKTGAVVTKLKPMIVVNDPKAKPAMTHVPVAIMASVAKGISDYHYGNDVALTPGSRITVTVTVKGQRAVLRATVPRRS